MGKSQFTVSIGRNSDTQIPQLEYLFVFLEYLYPQTPKYPTTPTPQLRVDIDRYFIIPNPTLIPLPSPPPPSPASSRLYSHTHTRHMWYTQYTQISRIMWIMWIMCKYVHMPPDISTSISTGIYVYIHPYSLRKSLPENPPAAPRVRALALSLSLTLYYDILRNTEV